MKNRNFLYSVTAYGRQGIIAAASLEKATRQAIEEEGRKNVTEVRAATQADLDWVTAMGGFVPEGRLANNQETLK